MRRFRRSGEHNRSRPAALRALGVLAVGIVCAAGAAWGTISAHPIGHGVSAAQQSFAIGLPVIVRLEAGQLFQEAAIDNTETPAATLTAAPTETATSRPTLTPSAIPTVSSECAQAAKQDLHIHLLAPNTAEVSNSSAQCTYPIGLASYAMFGDNLSHQQLLASQLAVVGPGQAQILAVALPGCAYQLDLFYGALIERFDPQRGQIYGERILVTRVVRGAGFCAPGTLTPTSISTPSATPAESPTSTATPASSPTPTETPTPIPT